MRYSMRLAVRGISTPDILITASDGHPTSLADPYTQQPLTPLTLEQVQQILTDHRRELVPYARQREIARLEAEVRPWEPWTVES